MDIKNRQYVISFSYGNYVDGEGGTDKLILEHQHILNNKNISLLHFFPFKKVIKDKTIRAKHVWGMVCDGAFVKYISTSDIVNLIKKTNEEHTLIGIVLHHLKNIFIEEFQIITDHVYAPIFVYLHDYMSICPFGGLIKNDSAFCGSSFPNNEKCEGCKHYSEKAIQRAGLIKSLFDSWKGRVSFIAPSEVCKDIWANCYREYDQDVHVIPHQKLLGQYLDNMQCLGDENSINIAFVGYQMELKGWSDWVEACECLENTNFKINLYHFGRSNQKIDNVKKIDVDFKIDKNAMINALRAHNIDVAILWSKVPETYSYTYFEAFASNCFVLTNSDSGNIAAMVRKNNNGYVGGQKESLAGILNDIDRLRMNINDYRKKCIYGPQELNENTDFLKILVQDKKVECDGVSNKILQRFVCETLSLAYKCIKR